MNCYHASTKYMTSAWQIPSCSGIRKRTCRWAGRRQGLSNATLSSLSHQKLTDAAVGNCLEELETCRRANALRFIRGESRAGRCGRVERLTKVPNELIRELAPHRREARRRGREAREQSNFELFRPAWKIARPVLPPCGMLQAV